MPVEALDKRRAMTQMSDGENLLEGVMLSQSADVLRVASRTPLRILGSASIGDDLALTRNIVAMSAAKAQQSPDPLQQLHNWAIQAGINEPYVGVLTAGSVQGYLQVSEGTPKWKMIVLLFADVSTRCSAGKSTPHEGNDKGGIDIIILTDASLSMGAMVNAMMTATEAKVRTLVEHEITTCEGYVATSAPSDSVVIACLSKGERIRQAGPTTQLGYLAGKLVHEALSSALRMRHGS